MPYPVMILDITKVIYALKHYWVVNIEYINGKVYTEGVWLV